MKVEKIEGNDYMSSKKTVEEHLIEEIKKSGYPLEIEVSSILRNSHGWHPFNQHYYFDYDRNQGRTIDINSMYTGAWVKFPEIEPFTIRTDMTIECKKSNTHAWVFFTIPEASRPPFFDGQTLDTLELLTNGRYSVADELVFFIRDKDTKSFLHYDCFKKIAIAYDEIKFSNGSHKNGRKEIFESINQIVKYICYQFERIRKRKLGGKHRRTLMLHLHFPVIVFEGKMYECIVEKNSPKLFKRAHILFRTHYRPRYSNSALSFGIDIVQRDFFPTFLKEIENDIHLLVERISEKRDELLKLREEAMRTFTK